jgi:hypothetical protein
MTDRFQKVTIRDTRYSGCEEKLPWMMIELTSLKKNKAKASKRSKDSKNGI